MKKDILTWFNVKQFITSLVFWMKSLRSERHEILCLTPEKTELRP